MPAISKLLQSESDLVGRFIALLQQEQDALKVGGTSALPTLAAKKSELAERLNELSEQRNLLLKTAGLTVDGEGMRSWLAQSKDDRFAAAAWEKLLKLAAEAKELNRLNGQLITLRLSATNRALETLTQQPQDAALYGKNGQTSSLTGSKIIDAA
jgi:flagella synthesis protein FlgN